MNVFLSFVSVVGGYLDKGHRGKNIVHIDVAMLIQTGFSVMTNMSG